MAKEVVVLGMSGGVDSSVAVHLLQKEGYDVVGVTMRLTKDSDAAVKDARTVAKKLGIDHYVADFRREFRDIVVENFLQEYNKGRTPNPCILCNAKIKFGLLAQYAKALGADKLATGHYAKIAAGTNGQALLLKGADEKKDQSYFLYQIPREILNQVIFPLSTYSKAEIRAIAQELGLSVAEKPDSQEVCFIPDNDYKKFLLETSQRTAFDKGPFCDEKGSVLGEHQGIQCYTIGQRKGLGLAMGTPVYVVGISARKNQVIIGSEQDLYKQRLLAIQTNWLCDLPYDTPITVWAKIRYRAQAQPAEVIIRTNGTAEVVFCDPQRAITPGQGVCFYHGSLVLGGGLITAAF